MWFNFHEILGPFWAQNIIIMISTFCLNSTVWQPTAGHAPPLQWGGREGLMPFTIMSNKIKSFYFLSFFF